MVHSAEKAHIKLSSKLLYMIFLPLSSFFEKKFKIFLGGCVKESVQQCTVKFYSLGSKHMETAHVSFFVDKKRYI